MSSRILFPAVLFAGLQAAASASASYHHIQIEQVIAGVSGDSTAQAIQLRISQSGDNHVGGLEIVACDASGANPIVLATLSGPVGNDSAGSRILICTSAMELRLAPAIAPDFVMTASIPTAYLGAGTMYTDMAADGLGALWRLSWGGPSYTGPGAVESINDPDGDCNPAYAGSLPWDAVRGLRFKFTALTPSTSSANDYLLTVGALRVYNNLGESATVIAGTTEATRISWGSVKQRYIK